MSDPIAKSTQPSEVVKHWMGEISAARKREKEWRKDGRRVNEIYYGKKKDSIPFNILHSNTETLLPALFNATPRPVVQRRFKDDDPLGKVSATAGQRVCEYLVDTNSDEYASFDDTIGDAVLDGLLPGRGASRIKYDAKIVGPEGKRRVEWETVCFESVKWDRWIHGFAKKWKRVPWVAFEHDVTLQEAIELFGKDVAAKLQFSAEKQIGSEDEEDSKPADDDKTDEELKVAKVWEIWDKAGGRKVRFISPNYVEGYLKVDEDPLELSGFYPMPQPLRFLRKANNLEPTPIYNLYENQAKELNRITVRINRVVEAIKVRGAYDSTLGELGEILKKDDNTMVAAENVAALQEGGLEKAIWLVPIDKLVTVLQQLYLARANCKQVIYEVTGISDILRGASVASETATAQEIKAQWGTLRLKRLQREVQRYARDSLRIALEIAATKFQEQTFAGMTGLPYAGTQEVEQATGLAQAAKVTGQQVDPKVQEILAKPKWRDVLALLRNDTIRSYRIDIETNSTVDIEAAEDQKLMGEVLTAISSFMQGVAPLVISGSMPFEVAQSMLLVIVRRYRFGSEIEDQIKQMKPPKNPDEGKQKAEQEKHQLEMQRGQQELANEKEIKQMELDFKREELRLKKELMIAQHQAKMAELQIKQAEGQQRLQQMQQEGAIQTQIARDQAALDQNQQRQSGDEKLRQQREQGALKAQQAKEQAKNKGNGKDARS